MTKKYRILLNDIMEGLDLELAIKRLRAMKNSYATEIATSLKKLRIGEALALLNASVKFEMHMELKKNYMTDKEVNDRAENLHRISNISKERAFAITEARNKRLSNPKNQATYTMENGIVALNGKD